MLPEVGAALRALLSPLLPAGTLLSLGGPPAESLGGPPAEGYHSLEPDQTDQGRAQLDRTDQDRADQGGVQLDRVDQGRARLDRADLDPGRPVLNVFLAGISADTRAMPGDWADLRDADGRVIGRQPPPRRFDLRYLVTAWTDDPDTEQLLLDAVLRAVAEQRVLARPGGDSPGAGSPEGGSSGRGLPRADVSAGNAPGAARPGGNAGPGAGEPMVVRFADSTARECRDLGLPVRSVVALVVNAAVVPEPDLHVEPAIERRSVSLSPS